MTSPVNMGSDGQKGGGHTPLTSRDHEILADLISAYDRAAKYGWGTSSDGTRVYDGVTPLDCGGMDGSDHSYRLTKLVKLGLAEHRKGSEWGKASTRIRGSKKYRPTQAARALLTKLDQPS